MSLKLSNRTPSCSIEVAFGDIEPGEMPPTSAWWPREATQNRISPRPGGEGLGVGVVTFCASVDECLRTRPRRCAASRPPTPPSPTRGEEEEKTGVHTVISGRCVPPLYG